MEYFKVHDLHLKTINHYLDLSKGDLEGTLCKHYKIQRLDQLNALEYDKIIEFIHNFIAQERQWK